MSYRIDDEPRPGALASVAVNPLWPLLAVMFGGAALSWSWFVVNGLAVGSPSRRREMALAAGGFAGSFVLIVAIGTLAVSEVMSPLGLRYAFLALTVWKLAVSYWLYTLQGRSFHLYEYFGGQVKNGAIVVVLAYFLSSRLYAGLPDFWILLVR